MAGCDFANARLGARRAWLLGARGLRELVARPDLPTRLEFLRKAGYAEGVPPAATPGDLLASVEAALWEMPRRDALRALRDIEGARPRLLLRAFLLFQDAATLKALFRGLARSEPAERLLSLVEPSPGFPKPTLRALAARPGPASAAAMLERQGSPFAGAAVEAVPGLGRTGGALRLESAIDREAFVLALAAARGGGEDARVLRRVLAVRADLVNARTLLCLGGAGAPAEFFVPGGTRLGAARLASLARLPPSALREALSEWVGPAAALASPFRADELLARVLGRVARAEARCRPLSLAVALSFLLDRQAEVRRIRLVLRGAEFGLAPDELLDLLET